MNEVQRLKQLRQEHKLTQRQIAEMLVCSPLTILRWENAQQNPRPVFEKAIRQLVRKLDKKSHKN